MRRCRRLSSAIQRSPASGTSRKPPQCAGPRHLAARGARARARRTDPGGQRRGWGGSGATPWPPAGGRAAGRQSMRHPRPGQPLDPPFQPDLLAHAGRVPEEHHRRSRVGGQLLALAALAVGEEPDAVVADASVEHVAHAGVPVGGGGGQRHGLRLGHPGGDRLVEPGLEQGEELGRGRGSAHTSIISCTGPSEGPIPPATDSGEQSSPPSTIDRAAAVQVRSTVRAGSYWIRCSIPLARSAARWLPSSSARWPSSLPPQSTRVARRPISRRRPSSRRCRRAPVTGCWPRSPDRRGRYGPRWTPGWRGWRSRRPGGARIRATWGGPRPRWDRPGRRPIPPDEALLLRATLKQARHDFHGALADLDQLTARAPKNAEAQLTRAVVLTVVGRYREALSSCDALAGRTPPC